MTSKQQHRNYRDELVDMIKDAGRELIERAEEMVAKDAKYISDFHIDISIPASALELPTISWRTETFVTKIVDSKVKKSQINN